MKTNQEGFLQSTRDSRGFILIMSYMLMMALSIFSLGLFSRGSVFIQSAERNKKKVVAFNAAEAGFDDAFWRIKNNNISSYPWNSGYVSLNTGNLEGGYNVTVTDMGNNIRQISATGYSPAQNVVNQSLEVRPITGYVQQQSQSAFNFGVFAKTSIHMSGNAEIDSYDSRNGAYGEKNAAANGDMATDSTAAGTIMMSGNATVKGSVTVGPKADPNSVITTSGNVVITGAKITAQKVQNPSNPSTSATTEGALTINGNTVYYLPAGTHRFSSISISGNGQVVPLGPVSVYVDGGIDISGNGIATVKSSPPDFLLYSLGNSTVKISGNGNFYGGIYAPNSEVKNTGNGQVFGAIVSKSYHDNGNGKVHFDEAMKKVGGGGTGVSVLSWQENNITAQGASSASNYSSGNASSGNNSSNQNAGGSSTSTSNNQNSSEKCKDQKKIT